MILFSRKLLLNTNKSLFPEDTVIFENSFPGNYSIHIPINGLYEIIAVGAGGGCAMLADYVGCAYIFSAAGGSGGYIKGIFNLQSGDYTGTVGALGESSYTNTSSTVSTGSGGYSCFENIINANGGNGGFVRVQASPIFTGGSGGSTSYNSSSLISDSLIQINGNTGTSNRVYTTSNGKTETIVVPQTASIYNDYGAGTGGTSTAANGKNFSHEFYLGTNGYLKITYKGKT